jgi:hypothetical protein
VYTNPGKAWTAVYTPVVTPFRPYSKDAPATSLIIDGQVLACILFANLVIPSYGADELAALGLAGWQVNGLAAVANIFVALAALAMAYWARRAGRWGLVSLLLLAVVFLALPIFTPKALFLWLTVPSIMVFAFSLGYTYYCIHPFVINEQVLRRERGLAGLYALRYHLVGGVVLGFVPLFGWQYGEGLLALEVLGLAGWVAFGWKNPPTYDAGKRLSITELRDLWKEARIGASNLGLGKLGWTSLYVIPGIWLQGPWVLAIYAAVAQAATIWIGDSLDAWVNRNQFRAAVMSAIALLVIIVLVALSPLFPLWLSVPVTTLIFTCGETAGNVFFASVDAILSLHPSGPRRQMFGGAVMFATLGIGVFCLSGLSAVLGARGVPPTPNAVLVSVVFLPPALGFLLIYALRFLRRELARPVERREYKPDYKYQIEDKCIGSNLVHVQALVDHFHHIDPASLPFPATHWKIADWEAIITYDTGHVVKGSDGDTYEAVAVGKFANINPVGTTGTWVRI